jgi:hypothetical protein
MTANLGSGKIMGYIVVDSRESSEIASYLFIELDANASI